MSSLILSNDLHLMMLEIAVENVFVPWETELDEVILKKTSIVFRMLDNEWTSLSPNRRDYRSYRGSNYKNEKFHGGRSVVFCVSASFFEEKASGVDVQLHVQKEVCKYWEGIDSYQNVGFVTVPVDNLLNSIRKQIHERNELAEHLSDFYKRQIISRSTMGIHTLLDDDFQDTAATISLYIRISYLGKSVITEIARIEDEHDSFCSRGEPDEEGPYHLQQLTLKNLQSGHWDRGLPRIPRGRLICRCEELVGKEAAYLAATRGPATAGALDTIEMTTVADDEAQGAPIAATTIADATDDVGAIATGITAADAADGVDAIAGAAAPADTTNGVDATATRIIPEGADNNVNTIATRTAAANAATGSDAIVGGIAAILLMAINNNQGDILKKDPVNVANIKGNVVDVAEAKAKAIKDKEALRKAALSKSKRGATVTIGIAEGRKRTHAPSPLFSCLQTYPLCCRLQPHPTCFNYCLDISPCYCYRTARPLQYFQYNPFCV